MQTTSSYYWHKFWQRRLTRRHLMRSAAVGGLGVAAAAAIGCGEEEPATQQPAATGTAPSTQATATATASTAKPVYGGTFTHSTNGQPPDMSPIGTLSFGLHQQLSPAMNKVIRFVYGPEAKSDFDFTLKADLAESWESPDFQTYTFNLRKDVKWHNKPPVNGRGLKAEDVRITFENYMAGGAQQDAVDFVDTIQTPDDYTVIFKLKEPWSGFYESLAVGVRVVFAPETLENNLIKEPSGVIGTGPFIHTEYTRDVRYVMKRNPDYFEKDSFGQAYPYLDEYIGLIVPDGTTRLNLFRTGQTDYYGSGLPEEYEGLRRTNPEMKTRETTPTHSVFAFAVAQNAPPYNDVRVRRAMNMAIDRKAILKSMFKDNGIVGWGIPWYFHQDRPYSDDDLGPWFRYNPEQAKQLMSEAGHPNGFQDTLFYHAYAEWFTTMIEIAAASWKDILNIDLGGFEKMDYTSWFQKFNAHQWSGIAGSAFQIGTTQTLDDFTYKNMYSKSPNNHFYINDQVVDDLVVRIRRTFDDEERKKLVRQLHDRDVDQVHRMHWPYPGGVAFYKPKWNGLEVIPYFRAPVGGYGGFGMMFVWQGSA